MPSKRSKGGEPSAPMFLQKTFQMISSCDPDVATWSGSGLVIKQSERFAAEVIPLYFKHSNIASFIRQLNIYGFRKVKADPLRIQSDEPNHIIFQNDLFQQGRPELLSQIKTGNTRDTSSAELQEDIDVLKSANLEFKTKLAIVSQEIVDIRSLLQRVLSQAQGVVAPAAGKQKTTDHATVPSNDSPLSAGTGSDTTFDADIIFSLLDPGAGAALLSQRNQYDQVDHHLMQKTREALSRLPHSVQTMFVDRLVEYVCKGDFQQSGHLQNRGAQTKSNARPPLEPTADHHRLSSTHSVAMPWTATSGDNWHQHESVFAVDAHHGQQDYNSFSARRGQQEVTRESSQDDHNRNNVHVDHYYGGRPGADPSYGNFQPPAPSSATVRDDSMCDSRYLAYGCKR